MKRIITAIAATLAAVLFAQAPEFSVQYQQRLGGALGELDPIVANFERDARRSDLTRQEALLVYGQSHEQFLRDRGKSMAEVFDRFEHLSRHHLRLDQASPLIRPVIVLADHDRKLFWDTQGAYVPAVPLDATGAVYAVLGFALGLLISLLAGWGGRLLKRRSLQPHSGVRP